jgi:hypothetical protein
VREALHAIGRVEARLEKTVMGGDDERGRSSCEAQVVRLKL